jgi:hypothetical protein
MTAIMHRASPASLSLPRTIRRLPRALLLLAAVLAVLVRMVQPHWHEHMRAVTGGGQSLHIVYLADRATPHLAQDADYDIAVQGDQVGAPDMPRLDGPLLPVLLLSAAVLLLTRAVLAPPRLPPSLLIKPPPRLQPPLRAPPR